MKCLYPIKVNGNILPCSRCPTCLERRRSDWSFRLKQELLNSESAYFITLTFNEENYQKILDKTILQKYWKRVRKKCKGIKYYSVGEYGDKTQRGHYHAIVFNADCDTLVSEWKTTPKQRIFSKPLGFVKIGTVTDASIHYVTGYIMKDFKFVDKKTGVKKRWKMDVDKSTGEIRNWDINELRHFACMSKSLGKIYLKHATKFHKSHMTKTTNWSGYDIVIPRYYSDKIFTKEEKEMLLLKNQIIANNSEPMTIEKQKSNKILRNKKIENSKEKLKL